MFANPSVTVCSVFVNPTQFNDPKDLEKYPRTIEADIDLLNSVKTDILFLPNVDAVYPKNLDTDIDLDFGTLDKLMEGEHRPGHLQVWLKSSNDCWILSRPINYLWDKRIINNFVFVAA